MKIKQQKVNKYPKKSKERKIQEKNYGKRTSHRFYYTFNVQKFKKPS